MNENYKSIETQLQIGIFKSPKTRVKVEREENGRSKKQNEASFRQRKVVWPSKEELSILIQKETFRNIAKQFCVSDKCITKWCKHYKLPYRKKDINTFEFDSQ